MACDPYQTLGLDRDASAEDIRNAYRRLAKANHPDHPSGDCCRFRKVQEAYEELRESGHPYEHTVSRRGRRDMFQDLTVGKRRASRHVEPLDPEKSPARRRFESRRDSFEEMFERLWRAFGKF